MYQQCNHCFLSFDIQKCLLKTYTMHFCCYYKRCYMQCCQLKCIERILKTGQLQIMSGQYKQKNKISKNNSVMGPGQFQYEKTIDILWGFCKIYLLHCQLLTTCKQFNHTGTKKDDKLWYCHKTGSGVYNGRARSENLSGFSTLKLVIIFNLFSFKVCNSGYLCINFVRKFIY